MHGRVAGPKCRPCRQKCCDRANGNAKTECENLIISPQRRIVMTALIGVCVKPILEMIATRVCRYVTGEVQKPARLRACSGGPFGSFVGSVSHASPSRSVGLTIPGVHLEGVFNARQIKNLGHDEISEVIDTLGSHVVARTRRADDRTARWSRSMFSRSIARRHLAVDNHCAELLSGSPRRLARSGCHPGRRPPPERVTAARADDHAVGQE